jgi:hypothetical protein
MATTEEDRDEFRRAQVDRFLEEDAELLDLLSR